ncbi:MAG: PspC domain-containing protein [Clostridia bacterium]|nr:PspC domain-containing protein [Clostridia bacterium]
MEKKLYKSKNDKKISGVCGGIAEYFDIDPTIIRIIWVIFSLYYGSGIIAYIACALIMPDEPEKMEM